MLQLFQRSLGLAEDFVMSTRQWTTGYEAGFFWIGVVMTIATIGLVFAGNNELVHNLERTSFPLSWAFGGMAVFDFVAAEFCHVYSDRRTEI